MSSNANASLLLALCAEIEACLRDTAFSLVTWLELLILSTALLTMAILIQQFVKHRILVHGNLLLLFANILLVYFLFLLGQWIFIFRYKLLYIFYGDSCQLLTPLWLVCCMYGPAYLHMLAYPLLHFCVLVERVRATLLAEKYEQEGQRLGRWMVAAIWLVSLSYMAFVILAAHADPKVTVQGMQGMIYLTSSGSAQLAIYVNYCALGLVVLTALGDWRITVLNRRIRACSRSHYHNYSLSRNFQLNENALAMRLILPLDAAYALIYTIFTILVILLRYNKPTMSTLQFTTYYIFINMLNFVYAAVCMPIYIRFVRFVSHQSQKSRVDPRPKEEQLKIHFDQLNAQWQVRQRN